MFLLFYLKSFFHSLYISVFFFTVSILLVKKQGIRVKRALDTWSNKGPARALWGIQIFFRYMLAECTTVLRGKPAWSNLFFFAAERNRVEN